MKNKMKAAALLWMCAVGNGRRDAEDGDRSDPSG